MIALLFDLELVLKLKLWIRFLEIVILDHVSDNLLNHFCHQKPPLVSSIQKVCQDQAQIWETLMLDLCTCEL